MMMLASASTMLLILLASTVLADPTVEINPAKPRPGEEVTFTVTIPDIDNIEKVIIRLQECGNEPNIGYICYRDEFNVNMTETTVNTYTASITLAHENAIEIKYQLEYLIDQGWVNYPKEEFVTIELDTSDQSNDNNNGESSSETPDFELVVLIVLVLSTSLIFYRIKR